MRFSLLTALLMVLITVAAITGSLVEWFPRPSAVYPMVIFLSLSTIVAHWASVRTFELRPQTFIIFYLGLTVMRILVFGAFIFIVIILDRQAAYPNVVLFLVSYFLFTALEVMILFKQINFQKQLKKDQKGA